MDKSLESLSEEFGRPLSQFSCACFVDGCTGLRYRWELSLLGIGQVEVVATQMGPEDIRMSVGDTLYYHVSKGSCLLCLEILIDLSVVPYQLWIGLDEGELSNNDHKRCNGVPENCLALTAGSSSYSGSAPMAPLPMAILLSLTGGFGVEKIVLVIYG